MGHTLRAGQTLPDGGNPDPTSTGGKKADVVARIAAHVEESQ